MLGADSGAEVTLIGRNGRIRDHDTYGRTRAARGVIPNRLS
jgi:hypothetical protein